LKPLSAGEPFGAGLPNRDAVSDAPKPNAGGVAWGVVFPKENGWALLLLGGVPNAKPAAVLSRLGVDATGKDWLKPPNEGTFGVGAAGGFALKLKSNPDGWGWDDAKGLDWAFCAGELLVPKPNGAVDAVGADPPLAKGLFGGVGADDANEKLIVEGWAAGVPKPEVCAGIPFVWADGGVPKEKVVGAAKGADEAGLNGFAFVRWPPCCYRLQNRYSDRIWNLVQYYS